MCFMKPSPELWMKLPYYYDLVGFNLVSKLQVIIWKKKKIHLTNNCATSENDLSRSSWGFGVGSRSIRQTGESGAESGGDSPGSRWGRGDSPGSRWGRGDSPGSRWGRRAAPCSSWRGPSSDSASRVSSGSCGAGRTASRAGPVPHAAPPPAATPAQRHPQSTNRYTGALRKTAAVLLTGQSTKQLKFA